MNNNKAKEMRINMEELEDYSHPTRYSVNNVRNSQLLSNFEDDDTYAGDSTDLDDDNLHSQLLENDQIINVMLYLILLNYGYYKNYLFLVIFLLNLFKKIL